jgi:hypothetical protein
VTISVFLLTEKRSYPNSSKFNLRSLNKSFPWVMNLFGADGVVLISLLEHKKDSVLTIEVIILITSTIEDLLR